MVLDSFLELVPPHPPSISTEFAQPFSVDLPDELLRVIFEAAVVSDMRTSRKLLGTAKWIRDWIARDVFTTQYIRTHGDMHYLFLQPDTTLALVRNLWVNIRSQRLPALLARMPHVERLALCISAARAYGNPRGSAFAAPMPLREFEFVSPEPGLYDPELFLRSLRRPTFRLTHLRLGYLTYSSAYWISYFLPARGATLPHLTHLAYDADGAAPLRMAAYRELLASQNFPVLRVLVVVVPDAAEAQRLLAFGLPRLVVLVDPPGHSRTRDWKARSDGKPGFWERAEALGVCSASHLDSSAARYS